MSLNSEWLITSARSTFQKNIHAEVGIYSLAWWVACFTGCILRNIQPPAHCVSLHWSSATYRSWMYCILVITLRKQGWESENNLFSHLLNRDTTWSIAKETDRKGHFRGFPVSNPNLNLSLHTQTTFRPKNEVGRNPPANRCCTRGVWKLYHRSEENKELAFPAWR